MALFLNEQQVAELLPMKECIGALEESFAHAGAGATDVKPRSRIRMPGGFFHFMSAADAEHKVFGFKALPVLRRAGRQQDDGHALRLRDRPTAVLHGSGKAGPDPYRGRQRAGHRLHGQARRRDSRPNRDRLPGPHPVGSDSRGPRSAGGEGLQPEAGAAG